MRAVSPIAIATAMLSVLLAAPLASARQEALKLGSPAPNVTDFNLDFIRGDNGQVNSGKVIVFEFWATWCAPCKASIPHINDMYKSLKSRGLVVVGISDETRAKVEPFVNQRGDAMSYFVAVDKTKDAKSKLMTPTGGSGIPHAVIVADGKIVFIGNPHPSADGERMEMVIRRSLRGRYDPELTPKGEAIVAAARRSAKEKNWAEASKFYDQAVEFNSKLFLDAALERYSMTQRDQRDAAGAKLYLKSILEKYEEAGDAGAMREISLMLATDPKLPAHDFDGALTAAKKYESMAQEGDYEVHSTLASVYAAKGQLPQAIEAQTLAWRMAPPDVKPMLKRDLDAYKQAGKSAAKPDASASLPSGGSKG